jgi:hypothetical protein
MPIFLDDQPLAGQLGVDHTIADALAEAQTQLADSGRMVFAMKCDDCELSADQVDAMLSRSISEFKRVQFVSGRCQSLAIETLRDAQRELGESFATVQEAAQHIAAGELSGAMERLAKCLTTWSQIHQAVVLIGQLLKIDFEQIEAGDRPAMRWLELFADQLRDLKDAVISRDHVLLGDLLRYELDETLRGWEQVLASISRHISK